MKRTHRKDLYCWSRFDEARNMDFNSWAWARPAGTVLVDPLPLSEHDRAELETLARVSRGGSPGAASSLLKNTSVDIAQELETMRLEAIHYLGLTHPSARDLLPAHADTIAARYLNGRAASIYGGSKEVQKNIIAKNVLGL